ncbi:MAG: AAA family ATPase [Candidatus Daviesbacteria bacterium]
MENRPELTLGFVGKICSGKGTTVSYLVENKGFYASSCSDRIREEILRNGQEITRETLQETAGRMRKEFGPDVLAQRTWEHILQNGTQKAIVDSIRGIEEVNFLKILPKFYLIAIEADQKIRFERILSRGIPGDPKTWEDFIKAESRDLNKDGRNIEACLQAADFKIENNGTEKELYQKLDRMLANLPT